MSFYVWLFPLIFIFHDMEEIIGFIPWLRRNEKKLSQYRKLLRPYDGVVTEGFALAVFEELILCIAISAVSYFTDFYGIWLGGFIGCTLHFVIHIIEVVVIRKYIPAWITSVICLPISAFIIYQCNLILRYCVCELLIFGIIGIALVAVNLKFAHWVMRETSKRLTAK